MRIKKSSILDTWPLYFMIIPFFKPDYFEVISSLSIVSYIYNVWEVLVFIRILIAYLSQKKLSKFLLSVIIYELVLLVSTLVNNAYNIGFIHSAVERIAFCMLVEISLKASAKRFLHCLIRVLSILYLINLLTIFLFPSGMYMVRNYLTGTMNSDGRSFLGLDNGTANYSLTLVYLWTLQATLKGYSKFKKYAGIVLFSLSIYIRWTASSMVAASVFTCIIIISEFNTSIRLLNIKSYFVFHACFFISIVILRLQNIFKYLVEVVLKKDLTFSGRLPIWDRALKKFMNRPFLGWGSNFTRNYSVIAASHAHNFFLHTLYEAGIIGFIAFFNMFLTVPADTLLSSAIYFRDKL